MDAEGRTAWVATSIAVVLGLTAWCFEPGSMRQGFGAIASAAGIFALVAWIFHAYIRAWEGPRDNS